MKNMKHIGITGSVWIISILLLSVQVKAQTEQDSVSPCRSVWEEIREEMEEAFNEIDWDEIREEMEMARAEALEALEWDEIREEMKEAQMEIKSELDEIEWEAMKKELQMEIRKVRIALDSACRELERELREEDEP